MIPKSIINEPFLNWINVRSPYWEVLKTIPLENPAGGHGEVPGGSSRGRPAILPLDCPTPEGKGPPILSPRLGSLLV